MKSYLPALQPRTNCAVLATVQSHDYYNIITVTLTKQFMGDDYYAGGSVVIVLNRCKICPEFKSRWCWILTTFFLYVTLIHLFV